MKYLLVGLFFLSLALPVLAQTGTEDKGGSSEEEETLILNEFNNELRDAVFELEDLGLIGKEGFQLLNNLFPTPTIIGQGDWLVWLDGITGRLYFGDVVIAGMINFQPASEREDENCTFILRADYLESFDTLRVGIDSDGNIFYRDTAGFEDTVEAGLDLDFPHHILLIAADDRLTVFVNGELIFDEVEVDERGGGYAFGMSGDVSATRCDAEDVWVYAAPPAEPDTCYTTVTRTARLREGPGTNFNQVGTQARGDFFEIVGNVLGEDGFIWLELEGGGWVRSDLVSVIGTCETLPDSGSQSV